MNEHSIRCRFIRESNTLEIIEMDSRINTSNSKSISTITPSKGCDWFIRYWNNQILLQRNTVITPKEIHINNLKTNEKRSCWRIKKWIHLIGELTFVHFCLDERTTRYLIDWAAYVKKVFHYSPFCIHSPSILFWFPSNMFLGQCVLSDVVHVEWCIQLCVIKWNTIYDKWIYLFSGKTIINTNKNGKS